MKTLFKLYIVGSGGMPTIAVTYRTFTPSSLSFWLWLLSFFGVVSVVPCQYENLALPSWLGIDIEPLMVCYDGSDPVL